MVFFPAFIFYLFLLNVLIYKLVFTPTDYIFKQKWCIKKDKTPKVVYLLKLSNKDTKEINESCSKWKYMLLFLCPYWWLWAGVTNYHHMFIANFKHFLDAKRFILFSIVFIQQIFFTFLDLLILIFYCIYSLCSKCARYWRQLRFRERIYGFFFGKLLFLTLLNSNKILTLLLWIFQPRKLIQQGRKVCLQFAK